MTRGPSEQREPAGFRPEESGSPRERGGDAPAPSERRPRSLLIDATIAATAGRRDTGTSHLDDFLQSPSTADALRKWIAWTIPGETEPEKADVVDALTRDVAQLDALLTAQVAAILHHPDFQRLEASWRGLDFLVEQAGEVENLKIRVLNLSWKELARDLERASEFDQSQIFRKIYSEEFDTPGGEPFGVIVGDYAIRPKLSADHRIDDIAVLTSLSHVAAAAFAPFIASADPAMFELDEFSQLERPLDLPKTFEQLDYLKWRNFRETEDARFVGLALPRILMRKPYEDDGSRLDGFVFREDTGSPDRRDYVWGNAAYAFAAVIARSFDQSRWLAGIRGVRRSEDVGGIVPGLPVHCFSTDTMGVAPKSSTEVTITDYQEQQLSELGFIPLCHCRDTDLSAFYTNYSVQKPKQYDEPAATINARMSAMLQYMLCVSRFAHYLKVIARDKIGTFLEDSECERFLHDWLQGYVTSDTDASVETKAKYPLREASVRVKSHPGKPGSYLCVAHLWPHFELEELTGSVKVTTELTPGRSA